MEFRHLKTFHTIATIGSFYRAAEVLGYVQSTVSEQMKILESELKVSLFKRAGNQTSLTPAGEKLFQYTQKMLNLEEEIRIEVSQASTLSGSLSLRAPETVSSYFLPPILKKFHQQFPRVSLNFNPCAYFGLIEELHAGMVNLAFLLTDEFHSDGIETETLGTIPLVMVAYPGHPLANRSNFSPSELKNEPFLVPIGDCSYIQILERTLTAQKVELPLVWRFNSLSAIKRMLFSGTGVTILPQIAVKQELEEGRLIPLIWQDRPLQANLLMIWQKTAWQPPILEALMNRVRQAAFS
jgi:DNA-binding transcriptional LysR family regulator